MSFNDNDLKRLKQRVKRLQNPEGCGIDADTLQALLARLEAAEILNGLLRPYHVHAFPTETGDRCDIAQAEERWRKVAGK